MIYWYICAFLISDTGLEINIIFTKRTLDEIYVGIYDIFELGHLMRANNVLFLDYKYGYTWSLY